MKKSVLAIIQNNGDFLILHRKLNWSGWELLKGGVEKNENEEKALLREIEEETGLKNVTIVRKIPYEFSYFKKNEKVSQKCFLVESSSRSVKLSHEHDDFLWAGYEKSLELLTHDNQKKVLEKAVLEK